MKYVIFLGLLLPSISYGDFFCDEQSSEIRGNTYVVCGLGYGIFESTARDNSLVSAYKEFDGLCDRNDNCYGHNIVVTSKRIECHKTHLFVCQRMIEAEVMEGITKRTALANKLPETKLACFTRNPVVYTIGLVVRLFPMNPNPCYPW